MDKIKIIGELSKKRLSSIFKEIIDEKFKFILDEFNNLREEVFSLREELMTIKVKLGGNL